MIRKITLPIYTKETEKTSGRIYVKSKLRLYVS